MPADLQQLFEQLQQRVSTAKSDLLSLGAEFSQFVERNVKIDAEVKQSGLLLEYQVSGRLTSDLPSHYAVRASNIIHQARATLDNAIWLLVLYGRSNGKNENQAWPVVVYEYNEDAKKAGQPDAATFERARIKRLRGLSHQACDLVGGMQPYSNEKWAPLIKLRDLSNADKHQVLSLAVATVVPEWQSITYKTELPSSFRYEATEIETHHVPLSRTPVTIARVQGQRNVIEETDLQYKMYLAFEGGAAEGYPVLDLLDVCLNLVIDSVLPTIGRHVQVLPNEATS